MTNRFSKVALVTAALMTQGAFLSAVTLTDADTVVQVKRVSLVAKQLTTDSLWHTTPALDTSLDGATMGAVTQVTTAGATQYWNFYSATNILRVLANTGGAWSSYEADLTSYVTPGWTATSTITLAEANRDGTTSPASPKSLVLTATMTSGAAALTVSALTSFLKNSAISSLSTLTTTGTPITSTTTITKWAFTAVFKDNSSAAFAGALDPIVATYSLPLTLSDNITVKTLTSAVDLSGSLVAAAATTAAPLTFTAPGLVVNYNSYPGTAIYVHTASIATELLGAMNVYKGRSIKTGSFYNTMSGAVDDINDALGATGTTTSLSALTALANGIVSGASYAVTSFATPAITNKYGFTYLGGTDLTNVTFSNNNDTLQIMGTVGATGETDTFSYLMTGPVVKTGTQAILEFVSATTGRVVFMRTYDATGIDTSTDTGVTTIFKNAHCANELVNLFNTVVTTIAHKTVPSL